MFFLAFINFFDFFVFFFFLQFFFFFFNNKIFFFFKYFLSQVSFIFGFSVSMFLSSFFSLLVFLFLIVCCFGGYFCYSTCVCGMFEFTFSFALISWFSSFLLFVSSEKFSVYMSKGGDFFYKTFIMLIVELVSEFSRPIALTVRLTVNILVGHMVSLVFFSIFELILGNFFSFLIFFAIILECFVFFIQSYIFSRLIFLYLNE